MNLQRSPARLLHSQGSAFNARLLPSTARAARCTQRSAQRPRAVARSPSPQPFRRAEASRTEVAAASASFGSSDAEEQPAATASFDDGRLKVNGSIDGTLTASIDDPAFRSVSDPGQPAQLPSGLAAVWQRTPIAKGWASYTRALEMSPVRTKAITSFFGFVLGDIAAQKIGGVTTVDPTRCLRLGTYGLMVDGPAGHAWYKVLDKRVCPDKPNGLKAVLLKTAADQLLWAPIMTCVFFAVLKTLEGHPELILSTIQDKLFKTIVANYVLWPGAHFINFRFVPSEHRILYNNCVSVAWNAYLSTLSHDAAVLDTTQLLGLLDQAQGLLDGWVPDIPAELADNLSAAFGGGRGLEGLRFDIPKSIDLRPTRTLLDWLPLVSETSIEKGI